MEPLRRHPLFAPVLAALASLAAAVAVTWPVALHPTRLLAGHPGNDNWNHAWGYWWVASSIRAGDWPDHLDLLGFPRGGTLYFIDTAQALLALPLTVLAGPAFAYNAVLVGSLALAGFGAWLLVRRVTGDGAAALAAIPIFGLSPHLLGQAYNGITETVCAGWIPLTLWALVRLLDRPTWARALAFGLLAALTAATSWYHGLFAALAAGLLLAVVAIRQPRSVAWSATLPRLLAAGGLAGALTAPLFLAFTRSLAAPDALVAREPDFVWNSLLHHNITDLLAFFSLSRTPSPDLFALYGEELLIVIHLGWVALVLAGLALLWTRRYRELAPWLWIGAVFFLLALGPYLNVGGEYVRVAGRRVPLPFLLVFELLPVFDRISHPFRFVTGVMLALAVLSAVALRHGLRRAPVGARAAAAGAVALAFVAETALGSPAPVPVAASDAAIPAAYAAMAEDPTPGAVLDLPLTLPNLERGIYTWYQTVHHRPVPWSLNEPMPQAALDNHLLATLIRLEATRARTLAPRLPELDLVASGRLLAREGYRYVVVHERFYPDFKLRQVMTLLRAVFGEPEPWPADRLQVFTLARPGEVPDGT